MKREYIFLLVGLIASPFFIISNARAQDIPTTPSLGVSADDISLSVSPETPGPNRKAVATLYSSVIDLTQDNISWTASGGASGSGKGMETFDFTTGAVGTRTTVSVSISAPEGSFEKSLTLDNGSVDLLWQGSGYVPPFYEGKRLWQRQGTITLLAVPHVFSAAGSPLASPNLVYRWSENGTILGDSSGTGKNSLTLPDTILGLPVAVKVDVMTDANTVAATAGTTLGAQTPSILVYENSPLYGYLFNNEAGNGVVMQNQEITLAAFPLFFSSASKTNQNINFTFTPEGGTAQTGESVTYRNESGQAGSSSIKARAENPNFIAQSAEEDFLVQFAASQPSL